MHQRILFMKYFRKLFLILFVYILFGEEFHYIAGFRLFDAGVATFTSKEINFNDTAVMEFTSKIKTNSFLSKFYKVDDFVKVWADKDDYSLIQIDKKIHEGSYKLNYSAFVIGDSILITDQDSIQLDTKVYDPISAIFMIRNQTLKEGDSYKFTTMENGIIQDVNVLVTQIEKINVPFGKLNARKVIPISDDGKPLFKQGGRMKVWYSDDNRHLPLKIEQKTNVGTLILNLKQYIP